MAETFAKYLAIVSVLDTARHNFLENAAEPTRTEIGEMIQSYECLGLALNEMNQERVLIDLMPEILRPSVVEKLHFIHQLIRNARAGTPLQAGVTA